MLSSRQALCDKKRVQQDGLPFSHSYWVLRGKLLAGFYPGAEDPEEADRKFRRLLEAGISCLINLMEEDEINYLGSPFMPYQPLLERIASSRGLRVKCRRFPIRDLSIPSIDQMSQILDSIDEALGAGQPVYVHCLGGIGRTGTVVGCYLLRHGLAGPENVLQHIAELRKDTPELYYRRSPETEEQRRFVLEWASVDRPDGTSGFGQSS